METETIEQKIERLKIELQDAEANLLIDKAYQKYFINTKTSGNSFNVEVQVSRSPGTVSTHIVFIKSIVNGKTFERSYPLTVAMFINNTREDIQEIVVKKLHEYWDELFNDLFRDVKIKMQL